MAGLSFIGYNVYRRPRNDKSSTLNFLTLDVLNEHRSFRSFIAEARKSEGGSILLSAGSPR